MSKKKLPTTEELEQIAEAAWVEVLGGEEATEETIKNIITNAISSSVRKACLRAAGLGESFGRLEIDHCNGRMSSIDQMFREHAPSEFVEQITTEIAKVKLTASEKKVIRDGYKRVLRDECYSYAIHRAKEDAKEKLDSIISGKDTE